MSLQVNKKISRGWETISVVDENDPTGEQRIVYKINRIKKLIKYFPKTPFRSENIVDEILISGFTELPPEFKDKGTISASDFVYQTNKLFKDKSIKKVTIEKNIEESFVKKLKNRKYVTIAYNDFQKIVNSIKSTRSLQSKEISDEYKKLFFSLFPETIEVPNESTAIMKSRLLASLKPEMMTDLNQKDIEKILDFVTEILSSRYATSYNQHKLFGMTKSKFDGVALEKLVEEFEQLMDQKVSEKEWGKFIKRNLSFIFRHYIQVIPELNVITAGARKVDFGAIDAFHYMDIIEIKKPETSLLSLDKSHDNYFLHAETVKAITQAEKYLYNAERKGSDLVEDIKNIYGIEVKVTRPKTILIIGNTKLLKTDKEREDFRINRQSLKNIEIITYDELLQSLKNQIK